MMEVLSGLHGELYRMADEAEAKKEEPKLEYAKVKLTKKQVGYIEDGLYGLGFVTEYRDDPDFQNGGKSDLVLIDEELKERASDGTCVVSVSHYLLWRLDADHERMHPAGADNDWQSVQEYSYALRFYRKLLKAAKLAGYRS
jgi:hypothetical protein